MSRAHAGLARAPPHPRGEGKEASFFIPSFICCCLLLLLLMLLLLLLLLLLRLLWGDRPARRLAPRLIPSAGEADHCRRPTGDDRCNRGLLLFKIFIG
jgi:hypothetical protein